MVVVLSSLAGSRARAIELIQPLRDLSPIIDARNVVSHAQGFVDEICAQLMLKRIDKVTFIQAPEKFRELFMRAHFLRGGKFLVDFR